MLHSTFQNLPDALIQTILDYANETPFRKLYDDKSKKWIRKTNPQFALLNKVCKFIIDHPPDYYTQSGYYNPSYYNPDFMNLKVILLNLVLFGSSAFYAQEKTAVPLKKEIKYPELKKTFNEERTHYIKATVVGQFWTRYTDMNPGTTIKSENGTTAAGTNTASPSASAGGYGNVSPFDIGIRRLRVNEMAQLTDRVFFYCQFGQNNFNYTSTLYTGAFVHDAVGEYKIHKTALTIWYWFNRLEWTNSLRGSRSRFNFRNWCSIVSTSNEWSK